jgi:myosin heavy subunit
VTFFSATSSEEDEDDFDTNDQEEESDMSSVYREYPFIGYTYTSFSENAPDPTESKSITRTGSNQEFIAKLRQKMTSSNSTQDGNGLQKKHMDEIAALKEEHKAEIARLKTLVANKEVELRQTQVLLKESQLETEAASFTAKTCQEQYKQLQLKSAESQSMVERESQQLKEQLTDSNNRNTAMQSLLDDAQDQVSKTKSEMSSVITTLEQQLSESMQKYNELQLQFQVLETDRNELKIALEASDISAQLKVTIDQQQQKICQLEDELSQTKKVNQQYKSDILVYQEHNSQLEKENKGYNLLQSTAQTQLKDQIIGLQGELQIVNEKLMMEQKSLKDLKEHYDTKLYQQSNDYNSLKSEYEGLKSELALVKSTSPTMKRSNKILPNIPTPNDSQPSLTDTNLLGESRSILSTMWKRDREFLKQAQDALETSENQLAFAKRQVLQLKKEVKCLQKCSFEQQPDKELIAGDVRNSDVLNLKDAVKNNMDHHQRNVQCTGHFKAAPAVPLRQNLPDTIAQPFTSRENSKASKSLNKVHPVQKATSSIDAFASKKSTSDLPKKR